MLRAVSSRELSEWLAFEAEHGPVWLRPDQPAAMIVQTLANIYRDPKAHPEPFDLADFLIGGVEGFEQTPEQQAAIAAMTSAVAAAAESRTTFTRPDE